MQLSILSPGRAMSGFRRGFELEILPEDWGIWPAICTKHQILSFWYISKRACDLVSRPQGGKFDWFPARSNPYCIPTLPMLGGVGLTVNSCIRIAVTPPLPIRPWSPCSSGILLWVFWWSQKDLCLTTRLWVFPMIEMYIIRETSLLFITKTPCYGYSYLSSFWCVT